MNGFENFKNMIKEDKASDNPTIKPYVIRSRFNQPVAPVAEKAAKPVKKGNKTTFSVTLPDGRIVKRTSANEYKFATVVFSDYHNAWGVTHWTTRRDLAEKYIKQAENHGATKTMIVPL